MATKKASKIVLHITRRPSINFGHPKKIAPIFFFGGGGRGGEIALAENFNHQNGRGMMSKISVAHVAQARNHDTPFVPLPKSTVKVK